MVIVELLLMPSVGAAYASGTDTRVLINEFSGEVDGYAMCGGVDHYSTGPIYHYGRAHIQSDVISGDGESWNASFYGNNTVWKYGDYIDGKVVGWQNNTSGGTLMYGGTQVWIWGSYNNDVVISWYDPTYHRYVPWFRVTAPSDNGIPNGPTPVGG